MSVLGQKQAVDVNIIHRNIAQSRDGGLALLFDSVSHQGLPGHVDFHRIKGGGNIALRATAIRARAPARTFTLAPLLRTSLAAAHAHGSAAATCRQPRRGRRQGRGAMLRQGAGCRDYA